MNTYWYLLVFIGIIGSKNKTYFLFFILYTITFESKVLYQKTKNSIKTTTFLLT